MPRPYERPVKGPNGSIADFRSVCRGRIVASRRESLPPLGEGGAPARRMRGKCPASTPSSVTCGDSFPQRGKPYLRFTRKFCVAVRSRAGHAPPLRSTRKWGLTGRLRIFGRFVGDAYMRPVRFARWVCVAVRSRAGHAPPLRSTRNVVITVRLRAPIKNVRAKRAHHNFYLLSL